MLGALPLALQEREHSGQEGAGRRVAVQLCTIPVRTGVSCLCLAPDHPSDLDSARPAQEVWEEHVAGTSQWPQECLQGPGMPGGSPGTGHNQGC